MTYKEALHRLECGGASRIADVDIRADYEATIAEALMKQISQKPNGTWIAECPTCGSEYGVRNDDYGDRPKHCTECGQAIEWGIHATLNNDCQWK